MAKLTIEINDWLLAKATREANDEYGFSLEQIIADMLADIAFLKTDENYFSHRFSVLERVSDNEMSKIDAIKILGIKIEHLNMLMKIYGFSEATESDLEYNPEAIKAESESLMRKLNLLEH